MELLALWARVERVALPPERPICYNQGLTSPRFNHRVNNETLSQTAYG